MDRTAFESAWRVAKCKTTDRILAELATDFPMVTEGVLEPAHTPPVAFRNSMDNASTDFTSSGK